MTTEHALNNTTVRLDFEFSIGAGEIFRWLETELSE